MTMIPRSACCLFLLIVSAAIIHMPASAFIEGGGYSGPTDTLTTKEMIDRGIRVREGSRLFQFSPKADLEFSYLGELEWGVPRAAMADSSAAQAVEITKVVSFLPENDVRSRVGLRGDAILKFSPDGTATIIPKSETDAVVRTLLDSSKLFQEELANALAVLPDLSNRVDELDDRVQELQNQTATTSGFVYGALAAVGTGILGFLGGVLRAKKRKYVSS